MIVIGKILVSHEIVENKFACNLSECKGFCCCEGNGGASLEPNEAIILEKIFPVISKYLKNSSIKKIKKEGFWVRNFSNGIETPLDENGWCVYAIEKNERIYCGIEYAWHDKKINFRKPISCHLYPIRIRKFGIFEALIFEQWNICRIISTPEIPFLFEFVSDALQRKYGTDFVEKLRKIAKNNKTVL